MSDEWGTTAPAGLIATPQAPDEAASRLPAATIAELEGLAEAARLHRERRVAPSTRLYHQADWAQYEAWCGRLSVPALPVDPRLVGLYITDMARQTRPDGTLRYKASSLQRHVASISRKHYETGGGKGLGEHEAISDVMAGIRRDRQERVDGKKALLLKDVMDIQRAMEFTTWPTGVTAIRDSFAIWVGFTTALRRSEVAGLKTGDVTLDRERGLIFSIGKSKTDQEGRGALLGVPYGSSPRSCVPCAWVRWLRLLAAEGRGGRMRVVLNVGEPQRWKHICRDRDLAGRLLIPSVPQDVPLFRSVNRAGELSEKALSDGGLNTLLKRRLEAAGKDPRPYGFHSLRAGFVTQARENGADHRSIKKQTRHKSDATVERYDRANPFKDNAVDKLGL